MIECEAKGDNLDLSQLIINNTEFFFFMQNIDKLIIIILSEKSSSSSYFSASYESIRVVQVTVQVLSLDGRTSQVLLERGYLFILFVVHSFTDKT